MLEICLNSISFCKFTFHGKANLASQKLSTPVWPSRDKWKINISRIISSTRLDYGMGRVEVQKLHLKKLIKNGDTFDLARDLIIIPSTFLSYICSIFSFKTFKVDKFSWLGLFWKTKEASWNSLFNCHSSNFLCLLILIEYCLEYFLTFISPNPKQSWDH